MKILYLLSNISYPPLEGAHEQTLRIIKKISEGENDVYLFSNVKNLHNFDIEEYKRYSPEVKIIDIEVNSGSYSLRLFLSYFFVCILGLFDFSSNKFFKKISLINMMDYDVIHVEGMPLLLLGKILNKKNIIFSPIDAWSLRQYRLMLEEKNIFKYIARFFSYKFSLFLEKKYFKYFKRIHVVSREDANYLRKFTKHSNIFDISVALPDINFFEKKSIIKVEDKILLIGDIRVPYIYEGIEKFLFNVYPFINKAYSNTSVEVVSRVEPYGVLQDFLKDNISIKFTPWVYDLYQVCKSSNIIVLNDLNGTGQKNRTILALSSGRPVVGTISAFQGIDVVNYKDAYIYSSENNCVDILKELISSPKLCREIGENGKNYALKNFSLNHIVNLWINVYTEISE